MQTQSSNSPGTECKNSSLWIQTKTSHIFWRLLASTDLNFAGINNFADDFILFNVIILT